MASGQVRAAWLSRWQGLLGCEAVCFSLLDGPVASGADGAIPSMNTVLTAHFMPKKSQR